MEDCIFCKIAKGIIPCYKIYEDKDTMAFLDIKPATKGHTLIIPKEHFPTLYETDDTVLTHLIMTVKNIAPKIQKALNAKGMHITIAGEDVPHTHIHIIPRYENDGIKWPKTENLEKEDAEKIIKTIKKFV